MGVWDIESFLESFQFEELYFSLTEFILSVVYSDKLKKSLFSVYTLFFYFLSTISNKGYFNCKIIFKLVTTVGFESDPSTTIFSMSAYLEKNRPR